MAISNFTNITNYFQNVTTIQRMFNVANLNTGGYAWTVLLFMEFVILLVSLLGYGLPSAILSSAFVCLISGLFLVFLELVAWQWLMPYLAMIIVTAIVIEWTRTRD